VHKGCRCAPSIRETSALALSGEVSFVVILAFFQRVIDPRGLLGDVAKHDTIPNCPYI